MSANAERAMYDADRAAWIAYVAPGMARGLMLQDDAKISELWARMSREYQTAVWALLAPAEQERVKAARKVDRRRIA